MPHRPVQVRRWQVVAAFFAMVAIAVASSAIEDHRINRADERIQENSAKIAEARVEARVEKQITDARSSAALARAAQAKETARKICVGLSEVKGQIVATLRSQRGQAETYVGRLPGYTQKDAALAESRLNAAIRKFTPKPCPAPARIVKPKEPSK